MSKTDIGLSDDDQYLYVLAPSVVPDSGDTSLIRGYSVGADGRLRSIEQTKSNLESIPGPAMTEVERSDENRPLVSSLHAIGASGLAVR